MAEENQVMKEPQQGWLQSIVRREKRRREKNKHNWRTLPAE